MTVLLFEDDRVGQLDPVAIGRPAFAIACGSRRLIDLVERLPGPCYVRVRPHLAPLVGLDYPGLNQSPVPAGPVLLVNARLVPSVGAIAALGKLAESDRPRIVRAEQSLVAAWLPADVVGQHPEWLVDPRRLVAESLPVAETLAAADARLPLLEYAHDLIRYHQQILAENLADRIARDGLQQTADGVFLAAGARLGPHVITDTSAGPVVLEAGASVGPFSFLRGPVHLGAGSRVLEHASLKDGVSAGHTTKIGGEVECSIIEAYSNKQHHGFLGHSYLGSWVNLGAGTCNSDLKNTYGMVNVEVRGQRVATGQQFVGAVLGDYAKTAINTAIFTGKFVGVCSLVYGFVTTNVPSFVNYARSFGQLSEAPLDVMISSQRRMFQRRGVEQRPEDVELLRAMYGLTAHEREAYGEPLSLEPLSL